MASRNLLCVRLSKTFIRTDNILRKNMCYGQSRQPEIASRHWKCLFLWRVQNHYIWTREEPLSCCCFHFKVSVFWAHAVFCLASRTVWSVLPHLTEGCSVSICFYLAVQVLPRFDFLHRPICCMQVVCRLSLLGALDFLVLSLTFCKPLLERFNDEVWVCQETLRRYRIDSPHIWNLMRRPFSVNMVRLFFSKVENPYEINNKAINVRTISG